MLTHMLMVTKAKKAHMHYEMKALNDREANVIIFYGM